MTSLLTSQFSRTIFIDSSNIEEIKKWNSTGIIGGVTTNQSIMLKDGINFKDFNKVIKAICKEMGNKPVSVELTDSNASIDTMIAEAKAINSLASNIAVKVPLIPATTKSLEVIQALISLNIAINITTLMTFEQMVISTLALRASKKPCFISLFWGRSTEDQIKYRSRFDFMADYKRVGLDSEVNNHPKKIVEATSRFLKEGGFLNTSIIVGSIRNATMVGDAFAAGSNIVTVTPEILIAMLFSQRTIETIEQFDNDWKAIKNKK